MKYLDLMGELLKQIDFEKSEIIHLQELVFVCGGKASKIPKAPSSLRELLLGEVSSLGTPSKLGRASVLLAEEAERALAESSFGNLLDLEEFIAAVVRAVVLIVESPGSFCELGAFVKTQEICEKLIAIVPSRYRNEPSFITNGAIKYFQENYKESQVLSFHWNVNDKGIVSAPAYALNEMKKAIPEAIKTAHRANLKEKFDREKKGHLIYLTLAFCHLLRAAKFTEIKLCFSLAGISLDEKTIKQCVDTLAICKMLKLIVNGKLTYYVAVVDRIPIEISWKGTTRNRDRNALRWISRIAAAIEVEEKSRIEIFREHSHG